MPKQRPEFPPERDVILRDHRDPRWDGHITRVCAGPQLERSVRPGEIGVYVPTGSVVIVEVEEQKRNGPVLKRTEALEYRRVRTRLI